ncbi:MAG: hypothetical protein JSS74_08020, partial [Actinobacteria bacterium]|nr:hypothetical protein [Actinomycetota bacterium]
AAAPPLAIAIDLLLVLVFALHHSVFARTPVKNRITRVLAPRVERSTYVLVASALLGSTFMIDHLEFVTGHAVMSAGVVRHRRLL